MPKITRKSPRQSSRIVAAQRQTTENLEYSSGSYTYSDESFYSSSDDFIQSPESTISQQSNQNTKSIPVLPTLTQPSNQPQLQLKMLQLPICNAPNVQLNDLKDENDENILDNITVVDDSKIFASELSSSTYDSESYEVSTGLSTGTSGHRGTLNKQNIIKEPSLNDDDVVSENFSDEDLSVHEITITNQLISLPINLQNQKTDNLSENTTSILEMSLQLSQAADGDNQKPAQGLENTLRPFSLDLQQLSARTSIAPQSTSRFSTVQPIPINQGPAKPAPQQNPVPGLLALPKFPTQIENDQVQQVGPAPLETRQIKQQKLNEMSGLLCQITDFLYLSGLEAAQTAALLKQKKITHVINLCGDVCMKATCHKIKYLIFNVKDSVTESLSDLFYHCSSFIEQARTAGGRALIHCHQGVSRSASVVVAYLMFCNNLEFIDAFAHVRTCRPIAQPNTGFIFQITEMYRQRHFTLIRQMTSAQVIKEKLFINSLIQRKKVIGKDVVLRDLSKFGFSNVRYRAIKGTLPMVFYLDQISKNQPVMLFRSDQAFARKQQQRYDRNQKKNRIVIRQPPGAPLTPGDVQGDVFYRLQSKKLYIVTHLPIGTVIIIGKDFNRAQEDGAVMVINKQYQEMLADVAPKHLKKPNQFHLMNKKFRGGETFKKQVDTALVGFSNDVKRHLILFLTELLYFENIHTHLLFYFQNDVEKRFEELCNEQIFQYLMTKLLFFDARVNNDWEHARERERLQNPDTDIITNQDLNESGFYLFSNCKSSDIFQGIVLPEK